MPERWQDELKKLRHEQMPDGVRERAEAGPRREVPSDGPQRLVAGVVAFAVFIAAGTFAWRAFDRDANVRRQPSATDSVITVRLEVGRFGSESTGVSTYPEGTLSYAGVTLDGSSPSFEWGNGHFDTFGPDLEDAVYLPVPIGTEVIIDSSADRSPVSVEDVKPDGSFEPVAGTRTTAPTTTLDRPGRVALVVDGEWAEGARRWYFPVEVMDPVAVPPIGLIKVVQGQEPYLSIRGVGGAGEIRTAALHGGEVLVGSSPAVTKLPISVPGDARLWLDAGEAERLSYSFVSRPASDATFQSVPRPFGEASSAIDLADIGPGMQDLLIGGRWPGDELLAVGFSLDIQPAADPVAAPDVLHLTCTPDRATLDSGVVRAQADGVHIAVDASDAVTGVEIVTGSTPRNFFGVGVDAQEDGSRGIPIEPGSWSIGCFAGVDDGIGPSDIGTPRAASFTIVDPDRIYTPVALVCDEPTTRLFPVNGTPSSGVDGRYEPTAQTVDESVAAVPGILATDVVREAGYPDGPGFKSGPLYTVLRDGRAVARLGIPVEVSGSWSVSVDACPGTGVGPDAPPGAAGPTPDTAVVRCVESRTEVATSIVNAQADGLHLEVDYPSLEGITCRGSGITGA